jgi:hypothetical protein
VPPVAAYILLRPASFQQSVPYVLSTSQLIGLFSALAVSYFYASFWEEARKNPTLAMSLGDVATIRELRGEAAEPEQVDDEDDEEEGEDEEQAAKPAPAMTGKGKKKGLVAKGGKKADKAEEAAPPPKSEPEPEAETKGEPEPGTT